LSLFLKSEKIPALLYIGKGPLYRPFHDFSDVPSAYRPWAQISNHRRASIQALHLYIYLGSFNLYLERSLSLLRSLYRSRHKK